MNLTVNTAADATASLVVDLNNNSSATLLPAFVGDVLPLNVKFSDGLGGYAAFVGQATVKILFSIGIVSDRDALVATGTMNLVDGAYTATLNLGTNDLTTVVGENESVQLHLEIQASFYDGTTETLCQQPITIRNQLIA